MATINIQLSQKTVDQLNRIDGGFSTNLSILFGTMVEINSYISENFSSANSWSSSGNKVSLKFGSVATLTYTGTAYPDYPGSYSGEAVASSRIINAPKYFKETITGTLYYDYYATQSYLSYTSTGIATINRYKWENFLSNADFGLTSSSLNGQIYINSVNGEIYGALSNFATTASKIGKTEIDGNFVVSSNSNNAILSSVTGTLSQYKTTYTDKSFINVNGALDIQADTFIDESIFADETNFTGDDVISILLPARMYSGYLINSGQGNDIISAGGGGRLLFINSGQGDDEITLIDASPVLDGGDGNDTVKSSTVSLDLRSYTNIENLTLLGTKALNATGNNTANNLQGNRNTNVLDGQGGADTLEGGAGNDTYIVYGDGETITDTSGTDLVRSYASWTLDVGLENLTLVGTNNIDGIGNLSKNTITGNSGDNVLSGDAGNDILNGGAGNDTLDGGADVDRMIGGTGDDVYVMDNAKDTVTERVNEGVDTIETTLGSLSIAKLSAIENLTYTGLSNATLVGNALSNILKGSVGNDKLDGGRGADVLIGGLGDDTYIVDNAADSIQEGLNMGTDSVLSTVTFTLTDNVENLTLSGRSIIHGTGNKFDNQIAGNGAANVLSGEAGNDILGGGAGNDTLLGGDGEDLLIGGLGNDFLTGGDGADKFRFDKALGRTNIDTITDFLKGVDSIELDDAIFKKFIGDFDLSDNFVSGGTGVKALDTNDHLIFNIDTGALFYDPDGSGRGAMLQFATLTGVGDLAYTDFWIV